MREIISNDLEGQRLRAPDPTRLGIHSTAYIEMERRAAAMHEMHVRNPGAALDDGEPNGKRWAHEDMKALPHVWEKEQDIAFDAVSRSIEHNKGYASTITLEYPEVTKELEAFLAKREIDRAEFGQLSVVASMRDRARWDIGPTASPEIVQRVAMEDLEALRLLETPERLQEASTLIAGNMRNPIYKAEFERLNPSKGAMMKEAHPPLAIAFSAEHEGLQLWAVTGRKVGDDDDTLGIHWAANEDDASDAFKQSSLDMSESDIGASRDDDPTYYIIDRQKIGQVTNGTFILDPASVPRPIERQHVPAAADKAPDSDFAGHPRMRG